MEVLGEATKDALPEIKRAIELRLRTLYRAQQDDPALNAADPVITVLVAVADVAPELAADVAAQLGIELPAESFGAT